MRELKTKSGKTIYIDDADYGIAVRYQWVLSRSDKYGRVVTRVDGKTVSYKKLIWGIAAPKRTLHSNGNPLDLRKENVMVFETVGEYARALHSTGRIRAGDAYVFNESVSKASQGRRTHGKRNSEYIGVRLAPNIRKWQSAIKHAGQTYWLGSYEKEEYAAFAYDKKAIELFGLDARRNFPQMSYDELSDKLLRVEKENIAIFGANLSKRHQGRLFSGVVKASKYVGVAPNKPTRKKPWRATISHQNKQYHLGSFDTEEAAAKAYDEKAIELYGDNARLNFPIY